MIFSWWRSLKRTANFIATSKGASRRRIRSKFRRALRVEQLEDRVVPTTSVFLDVGQASGAPIFQASPTNTVKVFVDVGSLVDTGGISSAQVYVKYDPTVLAINDLTIAPGTTGSDVKFGPLFTGSASALQADYSLSLARGAASGLVGVSLIDTAGVFYTGTAGGQLIELDFHVLQTAPVNVSTLLDLMPNSGTILNLTYVADANSNNYTLSPVPRTYSGNLTQTGALAPSTFAPTDADVGDAAIQMIDGATAATPQVVGSKYIMARPASGTSASLSTTMTISGLANGVLANDTDSSGAMNAFLTGASTSGSTTVNGVYTPTFTQATAHGRVTLNEVDGSFSYTPTAGFLGLDSFSYSATDALSGTPAVGSATVTIQVGSTVSIPKTLGVIAPSTTVVVPVMIDDPDPVGSNGLAAATIGINYDATKFTVSSTDVSIGALPTAAGWSQLSVTTTTPGQIVIVESGTPITTTASGALAFITMHLIPGTASGTSVVNLSATVPAVTGLLGGQSVNPALALYPAPMNDVTLASPGSADDGLITISNGGVITASGADPAKSTVAILPTTVTLGGTATVTLTVVDLTTGLQETGGGLSVSFALGSGSAGGTFGAVTDNGNGTYSSLFTTSHAGTDTIIGMINGQQITSTPPTLTVPRGPSGTITTTLPIFSWESVAGATSYELWLTDDTTGKYVDPAVINGSWTPTTPLVPGDNYVWWIGAAKGNGPLAWSSSQTFTIAATPTGPSDIIATALPTFTWNSITGVTSYELWLSDKATGKYVDPMVSNGSWTPTTPLVPGDNYIWWIGAAKGNGAYAWSNPQTFIIAATLAGPSGIVSTTLPTFTWNSVAGVSSYEIWLSAQSASTGSGLLNNEQTTPTYVTAAVSNGSWTPTTPLIPGAIYTWWIGAAKGNGSFAWSTPDTFVVSV